MKPKPWHSEHGLTLTELTIVGVLASVVMLGLVSFYVSSQATWMEASAQAITQREATSVIEALESDIHAAHGFNGNQVSNEMELLDGPDIFRVYWWKTQADQFGPADFLIHSGPTRQDDRGPLASSICERFNFANNGGVIDLDIILRSSEGDRFQIKTSVAMVNRP